MVSLMNINVKNTENKINKLVSYLAVATDKARKINQTKEILKNNRVSIFFSIQIYVDILLGLSGPYLSNFLDLLVQIFISSHKIMTQKK